jgi:excisionase family DNA binding protein
MAQDYYTLEEAARIVRISPEDLKALARKGELRSFQDRGTWRFRAQDIEELARRRGVGSDPELVLGESPKPKPADSPAPRSPVKSREAEVFDFNLEGEDESVGVGKEFLLDVPGSGRKPGGSSKKKIDKEGPKSGPKSPGPKSPTPKSAGPRSPSPRSPAPKPGSDSDVRLVAEGSGVEFQLNVDSDAKLVEDAPPQAKPRDRSGPTSPRPGAAGPISPRPGAPGPRSPRPGAPPAAPPADSGVRLVPMDSDSDVRIVPPGSGETDLPLGAQPPRSASDSDIRLEQHQRPSSDEGMLTEEINLDEELRKEETQRKSGSHSKIRPRPPSPAPESTVTSPFELSEADLSLPPVAPEPQAKAKDESSDFELTPAGQGSSPVEPGSSDFELTPAGQGESPLELDSSDLELTPAGQTSSPLDVPSSEEDFKLDLPDDVVNLGEPPPSSGDHPASGISLENPADSGISLEQGGDGSDEIEFELTLDADNTPRPQGQVQARSDSDSEFELTLDAEDSARPSSDSEFELTLDTDEKTPADSDSEFELTLDDSGGLSPLESDASPRKADSSGEKDIFETDFEVPALEEESGSEAVALDDADTGLDSSDFDLALDEGDVAKEDESGSQVVALDEEADEAEATAQAPARKPRPKPKKAPVAAVEEEEVEAEEEPDFDLGRAEEEELEAEEEEEPARTVVQEKLLPAAPWGAWPAVFMTLSVAVMIVVTMLGFELVQSMSGYKSPGLVTQTLTNIVSGKK